MCVCACVGIYLSAHERSLTELSDPVGPVEVTRLKGYKVTRAWVHVKISVGPSGKIVVTKTSVKRRGNGDDAPPPPLSLEFLSTVTFNLPASCTLLSCPVLSSLFPVGMA